MIEGVGLQAARAAAHPVARVTRLVVRVGRKHYPGAVRPALESLEMSAGAGEIVGIVGPSGCGKSTPLGIVAGLDRAFEGSVEVDGRPIHDAAHGGDSSVRLGMMFQASRLMPWLTVLDNLRLVLGRDSGATERATACLPTWGSRRRADTYPGRLWGMQRRVALARAFAVEPELLLAGRAAGLLSTRRRRAVCAASSSRCGRGHGPAVLYVTHELREALAVADRVLFLAGSGPRRARAAGGLRRPREPGHAAGGRAPRSDPFGCTRRSWRAPPTSPSTTRGRRRRRRRERPMSAPLLQVEDARKSYGSVKALRRRDARARSREFVALLGPNGAGKTTLFQLLTGCSCPTAAVSRSTGSTFAGTSSGAWRAWASCSSSRPWIWTSAVEANLRFHARLHGLDRRRATARIHEELERAWASARRAARCAAR